MWRVGGSDQWEPASPAGNPNDQDESPRTARQGALTCTFATMGTYTRIHGGRAMRIASSADLARHVRARRRDLGMTQTDLAEAARVSRRWVSDLESGKDTAEFGLVIRAIQALGLTLDALPYEPPRDNIDLDELLGDYGARCG